MNCINITYFEFQTGDMTGMFSVHTLYEGHEIMFHVSTLLPFSRDNRQQVIYIHIIKIYIVPYVKTDEKYKILKFLNETKCCL